MRSQPGTSGLCPPLPGVLPVGVRVCLCAALHGVIDDHTVTDSDPASYEIVVLRHLQVVDYVSPDGADLHYVIPKMICAHTQSVTVY
jgi:hypothetical protein